MLMSHVGAPRAGDAEAPRQMVGDFLRALEDPLRARLSTILHAALTYGQQKAQLFRARPAAERDALPAPVQEALELLVTGGAALGAMLRLVEADPALVASPGWRQHRPHLRAEWHAVYQAAGEAPLTPPQRADLLAAIAVPVAELPYLQEVLRHQATAPADSPFLTAVGPRPGDPVH